MLAAFPWSVYRHVFVPKTKTSKCKMSLNDSFHKNKNVTIRWSGCRVWILCVGVYLPHLINVAQPFADVFEALGVGDVIDQHDAHGSSVVGGGDGVEPFLPCCVPAQSRCFYLHAFSWACIILCFIIFIWSLNCSDLHERCFRNKIWPKDCLNFFIICWDFTRLSATNALFKTEE